VNPNVAYVKSKWTVVLHLSEKQKFLGVIEIAGTPCIHSQDATWQYYFFTSGLIASLISPLKTQR
jgi:hypothetical protein